MADPRFYVSTGPHPVHRIAKLVKPDSNEFLGAETLISDIESLESAGEGQVAFYFDRRHEDALSNSKASLVICGERLVGNSPTGEQILKVSSPRIAYRQICELFYPVARALASVDPSAVVHADAVLGTDCTIHAHATIGARARIGSHVVIGQGSYIGPGVEIGAHCNIGRHVSITHAVLGDGINVSQNVVIGKAGFGFFPAERGIERVNHIGRVVIGNNVEIGASCVVDRAVLGDTFIGAGTKLDNLIQIAHGVRIGCHCVIAAQTGIAGSATIGDRVMIGGQVAISNHVVVGSGAQIAGGSGVIRDVSENQSVGGFPAMPVRDWHRQTITLSRSSKRNK